ncbi:hypothetical protein ACIQW9_09955 [Herminiimonas sp. NPDC097707]|uniref:hypothetical protein n=1 Tax=Herminiimonas sp. NPDC097707 TaxID=3364007 RepID=UPI00383BCBC4
MLFAHDVFCKVPQRALALSIFAVVLSLGSTAVLAADTATSTYQQERAACLKGQTYEDKATCLKEAGAALNEARRGRLSEGTTSHEKNALMRCNALPAADREDCARRVRGEGTVSGSVGTGGIYRETTTVIVGPQPAPAQPMPMQNQRY